jgi:hypothetical protein
VGCGVRKSPELRSMKGQIREQNKKLDAPAGTASTELADSLPRARDQPPFTMEPLTNTTASAIMDEWGKYIVKDEDIVRIDKVGVLENIQTNNPAISSVQVDFDHHEYWRNYDDLIEVDWDVAGKSIGASQAIKFLDLRVTLGVIGIGAPIRFKSILWRSVTQQIHTGSENLYSIYV